MSFCEHCEGQRFDRARILRILRATRKRLQAEPGCSADRSLYEEVMQSLVALAEERPEAVQLMRGRTFARTVH